MVRQAFGGRFCEFPTPIEGFAPRYLRHEVSCPLHIPFIDYTHLILRFVAASGVLGSKYTDTALNECFRNFVTEATENKVTVSLDDGFEFRGASFHNAGYDAYCTGCVFAAQLEAVGGDLQAAANKLFMMQSLYHMELDPELPDGFLKYVVSHSIN